MGTLLDDLVSDLRDIVGSLNPATMRADDALRFVDAFSEIARLGDAGRMLAAGRVQQTRAWRSTGAASGPAWLASRSGVTLGAAADSLKTAAALDLLPEVKSALIGGELSSVQAAEIAAAAIVDPAAEGSLVELASRESVEALREKCRDVRAAAVSDESSTERIRRGRYLRRWTERDGAIRYDVRLAPDDGAPLDAVINLQAERLFLEARRAGQLEPREAYAADALCGLVKGARVKTVVNVHVSASALERGHTVAGETCHIAGLGPVSVSAARKMAVGGWVNLLETDGVDVLRVAHAGRTISSRMVTALMKRDTTCVVPGCNRRHGLEIDHIVPLHEGGLTELSNLARLCHWHHTQKTHHGWVLGGSPNAWTWTRRPHKGRREAARGP